MASSIEKTRQHLEQCADDAEIEAAFSVLDEKLHQLVGLLDSAEAALAAEGKPEAASMNGVKRKAET